MTKRKERWEKISDAFGGQFELVGETGETHITPANREQLFSYFSLLRKRNTWEAGYDAPSAPDFKTSLRY
ncbi:MAG: hypothetical protein NUV76_01470 [Candidatus Kuenenia sp.]|nr:hypothetical protein [Candidatus Kuenenia sp.]